MTPVRLMLRDDIWHGWTGLTIRRSIEQLCSTLELDLTLRDPRSLRSLSLAIGYGARVEVQLGRQWVPLWSGYLERAEVAQEANSFVVRAGGRSKTVALLKRETDLAISMQHGMTMFQLVRRAAESAHADYVLYGDDIMLDDLRLQRATTAWEAIERCARMVGRCVTDGPNGEVIVGPPDYAGSADALIWGKARVLAWRLTYDAAERYTQYRVIAQSRDKERIIAEARDEGWTPAEYIWTVVAEAQDDRTAAARAEWEAAVRRARALTLEVTMPSVLMPSGRLWQAGMVSHVEWPRIGLRGELVACDVEYRWATKEERCQVTLRPKEAYGAYAGD